MQWSAGIGAISQSQLHLAITARCSCRFRPVVPRTIVLLLSQRSSTFVPQDRLAADVKAAKVWPPWLFLLSVVQRLPPLPIPFTSGSQSLLYLQEIMICKMFQFF